MSLFGAKKPLTSLKDSLKKAKENLDAMMAEESTSGAPSESSGIGEQMKIARNLHDPEGTATTSEIAREGRSEIEDQEGLVQPPAITLPRDIFNQAVRFHNQQAREAGHPSQIVSPAYSINMDVEGNKYEEAKVYMISDDSSALSSPPPTTDYGGSNISYLKKTQSTKYEGSILAMPPSALPMDPFSTPRASTGIIAQRYIQSEENASQHAEKEGGMEETRRSYTPIPRKFEISNSEDEAITEVERREEEPYMTPTKKGKKHNKGKGVVRPVTSERPFLNMP